MTYYTLKLDFWSEENLINIQITLLKNMKLVQCRSPCIVIIIAIGAESLGNDVWVIKFSVYITLNLSLAQPFAFDGVLLFKKIYVAQNIIRFIFLRLHINTLIPKKSCIYVAVSSPFSLFFSALLLARNAPGPLKLKYPLDNVLSSKVKMDSLFFSYITHWWLPFFKWIIDRLLSPLS